MIDSKPLGRREMVISALLLVLLALCVRLPLISQGPMMDELYHLFAAKSWLSDGELTIADGIYTRAAGYTKLIAYAFGLFGEHIEVLRMVGVISAVALLIILFFWTRSQAGPVAAWAAALLFCLWPDGIDISVTNRFYAPHGMLFLLGAIGVYFVVQKWDWWERSTLIAVSIGAALMFGLAFGLQDTTLIGVAALGLWVGIVFGFPWLARLDPGRRWIALALVALLGLAALALLVVSGIGGGLLDAFRWTPAWAASSKNQFWFYHALLTLYYPTLWSLTGIAAIIAMAYRPKLIGFCLAIFIPAFLLHSLGGMKHLRYLYYFMPFLFVIWGVAIASLIERFWPFLKDATDKTLDILVPNQPKRPWRFAVIGAALVFTFFANAASIKTIAMLAGVTIPPMTQEPDWEVAHDVLEPWLDDAVLLTTSEMETLYAFDRYDMLISNSRMTELRRNSGGHLTGEIGEFSLDWRTGRPVVSEPESIELLMSCFEQGVIVSNVYRWRFEPQLGAAIADVIEERAIKIDLPPSSKMTAYRWETRTTGRSADCTELAADYPAPSLSAVNARASRDDRAEVTRRTE
ncbi:MAG: hypothetical protein AAFO01_03710 [Pseudomonadota bacterium]